MNQQPFFSQNSAKYKSARVSLLTLVILSFVNLAGYFANFYFLFSVYLSQILIAVGAALAEEAQSNVFIVIGAVLGGLVILPYLLCWIFSKKHVGWMIGALVLFSIDSLIFLPDLLAYLADGDFSMILDLVFRIWAIGSLILGVKYGLAVKKEEKMKAEAGESGLAGDLPPDADAMFGTPDPAFDSQRQITLARKKSFVGCLMEVSVFANGQEICRLKNGETKTVTVTAASFELGAMFNNGLVSVSCTVPAGEAPLSYHMELKMAPSSIVLTPMEQ